MEQFSRFIGDLKATHEGNGTMLDHCISVYGAGIADPNVHDHDHCPTLMVGNAGSPIRLGQHVRFRQGTPVSNLHLTMLDALGAPTETLGNSEGKLDFVTGIWIIVNGIFPSGMPASENVFSDEDMWRMVLYIRHLPVKGSLAEPKAPATTTN